MHADPVCPGSGVLAMSPRGLRPCPAPGCPELIEPSQRRCPTHAQQHERSRGTRQQRGYDATYDRERRRWAPKVARGRVDCTSCGQRIQPGEPWDLGHNDDRTRITGPEHQACNRAAGGRAAHP